MEEGDDRFERPFEENAEGRSDEIHDMDKLDDLLTSEIENRRPRQLDEKQVEVVGVFEHHEQGMPPGSSPAFVLLRDKQDRQVLIWVGRPEAYAISMALENVSFDRPMTHDLLKNVFDRLGGKVERILIDDLWQDTYYAKIAVQTRDELIDIDSRPSDGIALALRVKAPIYMAESVLEHAALREEVSDDTEEDT